MSRISRKTRANRRGRRPTLAQRADRHELYEEAVQDPEVDVEFLVRTFKRLRKRTPLVMREDFCGTAVLSLAWAASHRKRKAIGVDLDEPTLQWTKANRFAQADPAVTRRVKLYHADVLEGVGSKADLICAMNFSYQVFHERAQLKRYFEVVHSKLVRDGIFVLDLLGGMESMIEEETETELDDFTYRWDQASFDPLTHELVCHIHFDFPDGSKLSPAFSYHWRLWTAPELRDLLHEAGFSKVHFLWERTDEDGEGLGTFYEPKRGVENQDVWWTYVIAER